MASEIRRDEWLDALRSCVADCDGDLRGWVGLPNRYHLVAQVNLAVLASKTGRLHNGKSTQWNREDQTPGRKVRKKRLTAPRTDREGASGATVCARKGILE